MLDAARLDVEVSHREHVISRITAEPSHPGLAALAGVRASAGFRRAVNDALPGMRASGSVLFQLLDDLPTALLVSGYAVQAGHAVRPAGRALTLQRADLCAGWAAGGTIMSSVSDSGVIPTSAGPPAPAVRSGDDPDGWHAFDALPPHGMRRHRRLDVWLEGELAVAECFFRDSHMSGDRTETVLHEYTVHAVFDPASGRFVSARAEVGALPYPECPAAAGSAARLAGAPAAGLRGWVRDTFAGPSTCTHLNDTLRSLADVGDLIRRISAS